MTVDAVAVFQVFDVQSHDDHGIDITDTTGIGKGRTAKGSSSGVEKKKLAGCTVTGMCGKVDSVGKGVAPFNSKKPGRTGNPR